jgi:hypothetical protein
MSLLNLFPIRTNWFTIPFRRCYKEQNFYCNRNIFLDTSGSQGDEYEDEALLVYVSCTNIHTRNEDTVSCYIIRKSK